MSEAECGQEYVWRFALKPSDPGVADGDPVVGFVRLTLRELLDFIVLTHQGKEVEVDGFRMQGKPRKNYRIFDRAV